MPPDERSTWIAAILVGIALTTMWLAACSPESQSLASSTLDPSLQTPTSTITDDEGSRLTPDSVLVGGTPFSAYTLRIGIAAVAAGDFNADGYPDHVAGGEPELYIFLGDVQGRLTEVGQVEGGHQPDEFSLADLDQDGDLDIAIANHDTDYLTLLLGDGKGNFQPAPNSPFVVDVQPHPHVVQAADLNGDGFQDLVVDHREGESLLILQGLGNGNFKSPGALVNVGGDPYRGMAIGDIDGDGKLDLVTPNPNEVAITFNRSDEMIGFERGLSVDAEAPFAVDLGDFNADGKYDLIAASDEGSPLIEIFLGDGQGNFEEAEESPFHFAPGAKNIEVGDFNGDGIDDAVIACWQSSEVMIVLGGHNLMRTVTIPGGQNPWGLAVTDLNGDGKDDLVIADGGAPQALVYLSQHD